MPPKYQKHQIQKLTEARLAETDVFARPPTPELTFITKTLVNIDAYMDASEIDPVKFEAAKAMIRNYTLLYLKEDAPIEKQNEANIEKVIKNTAEMHTWLSEYQDCWPARLYLNRYWKNRMCRRNFLERNNEGVSQPREGPLGKRPASGGQAVPKPRRTFSRRTAKKRKMSTPIEDSPNEDISYQEHSEDDDTASTVSSSDIDDSNKDDTDEEKPKMSLFDRVQLVARQRAERAPSADEVVSILHASPSISSRFPSIRRTAKSTTSPPGASAPKTPDRSSAGPSQSKTSAPPVSGVRNPESKKPAAGAELVKEFLKSVRPSLELHLTAFLELGIRDRGTLEGFLLWSRQSQKNWIDEENGTLQLTCLERGSLLEACGMYKERMLHATSVDGDY